MNSIALYTFGVLDPRAGPDKMNDFAKRAEEIFQGIERAPGFIGRAKKLNDGPKTYTSDDHYGRWGIYGAPSNLPGFDGLDPTIHIATLSTWRDIATAREFVYRGLHREALSIRHDWFLKGPWPGYVLWCIAAGAVPTWADGVGKLEALARDGCSIEHFTFGSKYGR